MILSCMYTTVNNKSTLIMIKFYQNKTNNNKLKFKIESQQEWSTNIQSNFIYDEYTCS